jgi:HAD superfamily hydrolase (TIGR01509 family)
VDRAALLDVDGTLMDANYQHMLAWYRAFREHGIVLPLWRIHAAVGMGGDQLVPALVGDEVDADNGDEIRETRDRIFEGLIEEIVPLPGARELISALLDRDVRVVLASSSPEEEIERYLELLDVRSLVDDWTTKDDVARTKPEPDLVRAALEKAGEADAVMVGDTVWDVEAAGKLGIPTVCVLTGGRSREELERAGAVAVYESLEQLVDGLDESPLIMQPQSAPAAASAGPRRPESTAAID